jgi:hypothetical protein
MKDIPDEQEEDEGDVAEGVVVHPLRHDGSPLFASASGMARDNPTVAD